MPSKVSTQQVFTSCVFFNSLAITFSAKHSRKCFWPYENILMILKTLLLLKGKVSAPINQEVLLSFSFPRIGLPTKLDDQESLSQRTGLKTTERGVSLSHIFSKTKETSRLACCQVRFERIQLREDLFLGPVNQINHPPYLHHQNESFIDHKRIKR